MKKQKLTPEQTEIIRKETQEDPLDVGKAIGCLFIGIILLIVIFVLFDKFINFITL